MSIWAFLAILCVGAIPFGLSIWLLPPDRVREPVLHSVHEARVTELLDANNREVAARRAIAAELRAERMAHQQTQRQLQHCRSELSPRTRS